MMDDVRDRDELARLRTAFAADFSVRRVKWSGYNLSVMLRRTGEPAERIAEMRGLLGALGLWQPDGRYCPWLNMGGVFDHGEFWGRDRTPRMIVGHPYGIDDRERDWLDQLARFTTLAVRVDDRPSYYGFGTNHVRIELPEVRRPFPGVRSTPRTRADARRARRAFAEEFPAD